MNKTPLDTFANVTDFEMAAGSRQIRTSEQFRRAVARLVVNKPGNAAHRSRPGPLKIRALDGECELRTRWQGHRGLLRRDPIRLVRMVNEFHTGRAPPGLLHHLRKTDGVGKRGRAGLAANRLHHPGKLDGVASRAYA